MYSPTQFQETRPDILLGLMERYPLATIVTTGEDGLVADHVPLLYRSVPGTAGKLIGHVAKHNPLWRSAPGQEHLLIFQGPSAYISPNWYATKRETGKVVPTWNYAVVHAYATLAALHEPGAILALLDQITQHHEAAQPQPWRVADAPAAFTESLLAHIVGVEFAITRLLGKWKVSQNQPAANRHGVGDGLRALGGTAADMAALVDQFGEPAIPPP